tara:strand:- start:817 stop:1056 length:240 start_codon:yes stop_codon:yes gene_type:complete
VITKLKDKKKKEIKKRIIHQRNKKRIFASTTNELKNVTWPGKEIVVKASSAILVMLVITVTYVFISDSVLSKVIYWIRN